MKKPNAFWEEEIYSKGMQANKYPYDKVVSYVFRFRPREKECTQTKILEVGCGTGNNLWFAAKEGFKVYGVDGSKSAIKICKERFEQESLNGSFVEANFVNLPYDNNYFDLVIDRCAIVCCNKADAQLSVNEVYRVLMPGGKFLFNVYSQDHSSYTSGELQADDLTINITKGVLQNGGALRFYSESDVDQIFSTQDWKILQKKHVVENYLNKKDIGIHAEWEVIVEKK